MFELKSIRCKAYLKLLQLIKAAASIFCHLTSHISMNVNVCVYNFVVHQTRQKIRENNLSLINFANFDPIFI